MSRPLFTSGRSPSTDDSEEQANREDAALLRNSDGDEFSGRTTHYNCREIGLFIWALVATAALIVLGTIYSQHETLGHEYPHQDIPSSTGGKRNLIFMVSDGMGPASLSLTRSFRQLTNDLPIDDILALDQHLIGTSRTRSSSSLITDSAAGATAFSCGLKSYNGAISMLTNHTPCGTVLEAAHEAGLLTGLVVTTDITDATPACFASHVRVRDMEDSIASQEIGEHPLGRVVDLMLGGGRCHFLPNSTSGSCRADERDITKLAQEEYGWNYINDRDGFDKLALGEAATLPLLGLFAAENFPFDLDRQKMNDVYPSLDEMARTALKALELATKDSDQGFFLMIEGSRIDHAGHGNDPIAQVHEVLAYDRAFSSVLEFIEKSDVPTVVVSTSDHETGGLAAARQLHSTYPEYLWKPEVLANGSHTAEYLAQRLREHLRSGNDAISEADLKEYIEKLVEEGLGIYDATEQELELLANSPSSDHFASMISTRAQIGWSTHGHSAVDVNIYGSAGAEVLRGNHENTDVGKFLAQYLGLNVTIITKKLRGEIPASDLGRDIQVPVANYHVGL